MSSDQFFRDAWVEIQLDNIEFNIHQLKDRLPRDKQIYAVVKANAYGHGDIQVAKKALEAGAAALAVSLLDEALKLREAGIKAPILVMGWVRPEYAPLAAQENISLTFFQKDWLEQVKGMAFSQTLHLHMKWDTGMGRVGIRTEAELTEIIHSLDDDRLHLEGIYTHFATADEAGTVYFNKQQGRFGELTAAFQSLWSEEVIFHTGNSAASMRFPEQMKHFVRFGISMYGLYPSSLVKGEKPITVAPAFSLHSRLIHVKQLPPGESVSYSATYTTTDYEWIGTIPLGYADGWIRKLQGMEVLVEGKRMPIVGRICMDQFMIRLDQEYSVGTRVTLIGKQLQEEVSMDEVANYVETINYEIPCMISYRVPRVYRENSKVIGAVNPIPLMK